MIAECLKSLFLASLPFEYKHQIFGAQQIPAIFSYTTKLIRTKLTYKTATRSRLTLFFYIIVVHFERT